MNKRKTDELAAILVNQYGSWALDHAKERRAQHAHARRSEAFRVWNSIAERARAALRAQGRTRNPAQ